MNLNNEDKDKNSSEQEFDWSVFDNFKPSSPIVSTESENKNSESNKEEIDQDENSNLLDVNKEEVIKDDKTDNELEEYNSDNKEIINSYQESINTSEQINYPIDNNIKDDNNATNNSSINQNKINNQTEMSNNNNNQGNGNKIVLILLALVALCSIGGAIYLNNKASEEEAKTKIVTVENKSLEERLAIIKLSFDSLRTLHVSDSAAFEAKKEELAIKIAELQLIVEKAQSNTSELAKAKKRISYLEKELANYKKEVATLRAENAKKDSSINVMQSEIATLSTQNQDLNKSNVDLSRKLAGASVPKTSQIDLKMIRVKGSGKEVEVEKSSRVTKLNIEFSLVESELIKEGQYDVYVQIKSPSGEVITSTDKKFISEGKELNYTVMSSINYTKTAKHYFIEWKADDFEKGSYEISLYTKDGKMGTSDVTLK